VPFVSFLILERKIGHKPHEPHERAVFINRTGFGNVFPDTGNIFFDPGKVIIDIHKKISGIRISAIRAGNRAIQAGISAKSSCISKCLLVQSVPFVSFLIRGRKIGHKPHEPHEQAVFINRTDPGNIFPGFENIFFDLKKVLDDIHKHISGIHKNFTDIRKNIPDIHKNILDIHKIIMDIRKNISDIHKNITDIRKNILDIRKNILDIHKIITDIRENISGISVRAIQAGISAKGPCIPESLFVRSVPSVSFLIRERKSGHKPHGQRERAAEIPGK